MGHIDLSLQGRSLPSSLGSVPLRARDGPCSCCIGSFKRYRCFARAPFGYRCKSHRPILNRTFRKCRLAFLPPQRPLHPHRPRCVGLEYKARGVYTGQCQRVCRSFPHCELLQSPTPRNSGASSDGLFSGKSPQIWRKDHEDVSISLLDLTIYALQEALLRGRR